MFVELNIKRMRKILIECTDMATNKITYYLLCSLM